jgi:hypothetical protein
MAAFPQPDGFEGLRVVEEVFDLCDPPISDRADGGEVGAQVDTTGHAPASPVGASHDPVAHGEDFPDLRSSTSLPALVDMAQAARAVFAYNIS